MRASGVMPRSPALRAVVAVAATSLFMVLVAWATLLGPDQVFTGPGPRPASETNRTESCIPLPVRTEVDGSTTVVLPDDYTERDYCDPPPASLDDYRDIVEDNPPPVWVKVLVTVLLVLLLLAVAAGLLWMVAAAWRELRAHRGDAERIDVTFAVLDEPARIADELVKDAEEQDALLRGGDPRNAIVEAWHRFEVQGDRAGVARRAAETSSEYALRILDLVEADTGPVTRLAELYREARFSDHPITERHRAEALAALAAIRGSLGVRT